MKDTMGCTLSHTANSDVGKGAKEDKIKQLCEIVIKSLAMERELHPLLTSFLTYVADRPVGVEATADDVIEGGGEGGGEGEGEGAEKEMEMFGLEKGKDRDYGFMSKTQASRNHHVN